MARASYQRWLIAHRLTGLFVMVAVVHGAIVDPMLHRSTLLLVVFLVVGVVGTGAYLYRELFARYFVPIYDYTVVDVQRLNKTTLTVTLSPMRRSLSFTPGQFVFVALGGAGGWERHPFSVSSSPGDSRLEVTIKASGDYTRELYDKLRPASPPSWPAHSAALTTARAAATRFGSRAGSGSPRFSAGLARSTGGSTAVSTSITRLPTPMTRSISTRFAP